ncbi:hypothetical protein WICPIJ_004778 [Wickerhamomyces pijperi]|uniref:Uncharacterized protein n=1 Tax=Wickerhamomyces pijperi TaxID=599730 RepID=A0A9P8TLR0_WICPI|nr:hypothetical protein WICPIJ_004778 [Wickerhamomyces pijperi]
MAVTSDILTVIQNGLMNKGRPIDISLSTTLSLLNIQRHNQPSADTARDMESPSTTFNRALNTSPLDVQLTKITSQFPSFPRDIDQAVDGLHDPNIGNTQLRDP